MKKIELPGYIYFVLLGYCLFNIVDLIVKIKNYKKKTECNPNKTNNNQEEEKKKEVPQKNNWIKVVDYSEEVFEQNTKLKDSITQAVTQAELLNLTHQYEEKINNLNEKIIELTELVSHKVLASQNLHDSYTPDEEKGNESKSHIENNNSHDKTNSAIQQEIVFPNSLTSKLTVDEENEIHKTFQVYLNQLK